MNTHALEAIGKLCKELLFHEMLHIVPLVCRQYDCNPLA